jgi:hypothetical protein
MSVGPALASTTLTQRQRQHSERGLHVHGDRVRAGLLHKQQAHPDLDTQAAG